MSIDDLVKLDKKEFGLSFELTADAFCLLNDYGFTASTSSDDMERHIDRSIDLPSNGIKKVDTKSPRRNHTALTDTIVCEYTNVNGEKGSARGEADYFWCFTMSGDTFCYIYEFSRVDILNYALSVNPDPGNPVYIESGAIRPYHTWIHKWLKKDSWLMLHLDELVANLNYVKYDATDAFKLACRTLDKYGCGLLDYNNSEAWDKALKDVWASTPTS